ncbi:MAG TPA: hypothetical protein VHZ97_11190 [Pseudonocardiaceae bacterium]|nr:hypothetical protein [Pseudonocardiaceae bacterium]
MWLWLANWWDGVELWLTQLPFPFEFAIVIVVLGPLCVLLAVLLDRLFGLFWGRK